MPQFEFTGVLPGSVPENPLNLGVVTAMSSGVRVIDYATGARFDIDTAGAGIGTAGAFGGLGARLDFTCFGQAVSIPAGALEAALSAAVAGDGRSVQVYLGTTPSQGNAAQLLCATIDGSDYAFLARDNGAGVAVYRVTGGGTGLSLVGTATDSADRFLADVSAMSTVTRDGITYLYAASSSEHGITGFRVSDTGALTEVESFGQDESLPVQTLTALDGIEIGGQGYLVAAAAGSNSLTVFTVQPDGTLEAVNHVVDDLTTRFGSATVLELVDLGGDRALVLAAGTDGGFSAFLLAPGGALIRIDTPEATQAFTLDRVSSVAAVVENGRVELFMTTEGDAGVGQFTLDISANADLQLVGDGVSHGTWRDDMLVATGTQGSTVYGGSGDDILIDGAGVDYLWGENGADTFVITGSDGAHDRIMDYQIGLDRIDLSDWTMVYSVDNLTISERSNGSLRFSHDDNMLEVYSAAGEITLDDLAAIEFVFLSTHDVNRAPLLWAEDIEGLTLYGGTGADVLTGGTGDDLFNAGSGDDTLISGGGADAFWGGVGLDTVSYTGETAPLEAHLDGQSPNGGAAADDHFNSIEGLIGGSGSDILTGTSAANHLDGSDGNDWIDGRAGNDVLRGGDGHDAILGRGGDDLMYGGDGYDNMPGDTGDDKIHGEGGDDEIGGGDGNDTIHGGAGNDFVGGGPGNDYISGGNGHDSLAAGYGSDVIEGGAGNDQIAGSYGQDLIRAGSGHDTIGGGWGHDEIWCGSGNDTVGAGDQDDRLYGEDGDDILNGGTGRDTIHGGSGTDWINGGPGDDVLTGGGGADTFVFNAAVTGERDVITDFDSGADLLRLSHVPGADATQKFAQLGLAQVGNDVEIGWFGQTILLEDTALSGIGVEDFIFV